MNCEDGIQCCSKMEGRVKEIEGKIKQNAMEARVSKLEKQVKDGTLDVEIVELEKHNTGHTAFQTPRQFQLRSAYYSTLMGVKGNSSGTETITVRNLKAFKNGANYGTSQPYWWLDLGNNFRVRRVVVYNRLSSGHRLLKLKVTAGKTLSNMAKCDYYEGRAINGELVLICNQPIEARYVKLQIKEQDPKDNYLHVAVVEVCE
ncbi:unnamed protein product [Mytilus coruscus]|uniref:Fucolectin tachylectin-4 pentraxin-1 domain-containing protein n=1 Tax=Mytilus coruscus TaxID=42192 RepID=A0A6J8E1Q0_MYTCO|nr:unnamed protein product [Mytilus coruscus]